MSKAHSAAEHGKGIALARIVEFLDDSRRKHLPPRRQGGVASMGEPRQHSFSNLVCG